MEIQSEQLNAGRLVNHSTLPIDLSLILSNEVDYVLHTLHHITLIELGHIFEAITLQL